MATKKNITPTISKKEKLCHLLKRLNDLCVKIYLEERNKELQSNIKTFYKYQIIVDSDGKECIITNKTSSSIEVYIQKKSSKGINCKQYFYIKDFEKRFKPIAFDKIPKSEEVLDSIIFSLN